MTTTIALRTCRAWAGAAGRLLPLALLGLSGGALAANPFDALQIAAGLGHSCLLTDAGAVWCWGFNGAGQLGDGTTIRRRAPTAVSGLESGVVALEAGDAHSCALTDSGGVWCWGCNRYGQLGDGSFKDRSRPVAVGGLSSGAIALAVGQQHSCALTVAGEVWCWGANWAGQLGDGSTTQQSLPTAVAGLEEGVVAVAGGAAHTCALTEGGAVRCWGAGSRSPLDDGGPAHRLTPTEVDGLGRGAVALEEGWDRTCALIEGGSMRCWGYRYNHQAGGDDADRHVKTEAVWPNLYLGRTGSLRGAAVHKVNLGGGR